MLDHSPYDLRGLGPALISFSGGRTSAYMTARILAYGLDEDQYVVFADTGKERPATYDFVALFAEHYDTQIHTVRAEGGFDGLIERRGYLPNPVTRFCTTELKIRPMKRFMVGRGHEQWTMVVGIRADEAHRARRLSGSAGKDRWDYEFPMVEGAVELKDVHAFWKRQPFDLQLRPHEGNCDLCFLKGYDKRVQVLVDHPELGQWWADKEEQIGATFRKGQSVRGLLREADVRRRQLSLPLVTRCEDDLGDCLCGD